MHHPSKKARISKPASNFNRKLKDKTKGPNDQSRDHLGTKEAGLWMSNVAVWRLTGRPLAGASGKKALERRDMVEPGFREVKMLKV
jgi:hypothetical protein